MRHRGLRDQAGEARRGWCGGRGGWHVPFVDGGPSRVVPMRQPRITGYGGRCVCCVIPRAHRSTPKAVGRVSFGAHSARSPERSAQRGSCGASLKHRARDAGGTGGLAALPAKSRQHRAERPNRPARDRAASVPRGIEARGSIVTPAFRAPSFLPRATELRLRTTGEPGARSNNTGGGALACGQGWRSGGVRLSPFVPAQAGTQRKKKDLDARFRFSRARTERPMLASRSLRPAGMTAGPRHARYRESFSASGNG